MATPARDMTEERCLHRQVTDELALSLREIDGLQVDLRVVRMALPEWQGRSLADRLDAVAWRISAAQYASGRLRRLYEDDRAD